MNKTKTKTKTNVNKRKISKPKIKIKSKTKPKIKYNQNDAEIRRIVNTRENYYSINIPSRFANELDYARGQPVLVRVIGSKLVIKKL